MDESIMKNEVDAQLDALSVLANAVNAEIAQARARVSEKREARIHSVVTALFHAHPTLEGVRWAQYAPYFNDGELWVFSVGDVYYKLQDDDTSGDDEDGWQELPWRRSEREDVAPGSLQAHLIALEMALHAFDGDPEPIFGNRVQVVLTADSDRKVVVEIDTYDHD